MEPGRIVEEGAAEDVYIHPFHPYTRALLSAAPRVGGDAAGNRRIKLGGEVPSPLETPSGCAFRTRCRKAQEVCAQRAPALDILEPSHSAACYFPEAAQPQTADPQPSATSADVIDPTAAGSLVLLRDGQRTFNAAGRSTGWEDCRLTDLGRHQARQAGARLGAADLVPDVVPTCWLKRAIVSPNWP